MSRPRLLDLFCGAGGAAMGYHRAGFEVTGVDIKPQPHFPFTFHQADALEYVAAHGHEYDAIHASPPCQGYSSTRHWRRNAREYPDDVGATRIALSDTGALYVIENVPGAPLIDSVRLCGSAFSLAVRRHRLFESNLMLFSILCQHGTASPIGVYGDHPENHQCWRRMNRAKTLEQGQEAMGIDWMTWRELTQAIPPAYTEFIGAQLMQHLGAEAAS